MSRDNAIAATAKYFDSGSFIKDIETLVAIPSESQLPEGLSHCWNYLEVAMKPTFENMGFTIKTFENPISGFGPVLLATRIENPSLPTILGYGHGDVIRGMEGQWDSGRMPWSVKVEDDRLYGRGTADNKSQHWINMMAIKNVLKIRGKLGFNAKFLIETGEENGSLGLREVITNNIEDFYSDVFLASDGPRVRRDIPTICLGSRGATNFELVCELREGGHHSGNWGGALEDPAVILSHAIASITDKRGRINIAGWRPPKISNETKDLLLGVKLDPGQNGPVPEDSWGEPDLSAAENVFAWNNFCVLAMNAGNVEEPVNAILPSARAHCQFRYIAGTDHGNALQALRDHLDRNGFSAVKINEPPAQNRGGYLASRTKPDNAWVKKVRKSIKKTSRREPVIIPQMGGSICNDLFTDLLSLPAIWVPHSYSGCSQHAPNEHLLLPVCREALAIMAGIYWDLGEEDA